MAEEEDGQADGSASQGPRASGTIKKRRVKRVAKPRKRIKKLEISKLDFRKLENKKSSGRITKEKRKKAKKHKNWGGSRVGAGRKSEPPPEPPKVAAEPRKRPSIDLQTALRVIQESTALKQRQLNKEEFNPFRPNQAQNHPPGSIPPKEHQIAMDANLTWAETQWAGGVLANVGAEGLLFLGYPYLSILAQRPEYRVISETIADDATRKWIDFDVTGDEKKPDKDREGNEEEFGGSMSKDADMPRAMSEMFGNSIGTPRGRESAQERHDRLQKLGQEFQGLKSNGERPFSGTTGMESLPGTPPDEMMSQAYGSERQTTADPDERADKIRKAGKTDKVKALKDEMQRLEMRDCFYRIAREDGFFGRSHLFMDFGDDLDNLSGELATPIGNGRDEISKSKVKKGSLRRLRPVEPIWCYPTTYNALNPLKENWYRPDVWYVQGREIHVSRMPLFIGHPVPDILKPAYSFGGLSLSQMAKPYVDIWLSTRESVGALIHAFSVMVLMTDLQTILQPSGPEMGGMAGDAGGLLARVAMFNAMRDNQGTFVINRATEDFKNVSASLGGLHELQAQAQEHMSLPRGTKIQTSRGEVPIEAVTTDDLVLTRAGYAPIKWSGITGTSDILVKIEAGGSVLRCTGNHPIWSESTNAFVNAENVSPSHRLLALETSSQGNTESRSHGAVVGGATQSPAITATQKLAAFCTSSCGRPTEAQYQKAMKSITSTRMGPTIAGITSSFSPAPIILAATSGSGSMSLTGFTRNNAYFVGRISRAFLLMVDHVIARLHASSGLGDSVTDILQSLFLSNASAAAESSFLNERARPDIAQMHVSSVPVERAATIKVQRQPVYDIVVDDGWPPEFFANGILVHNSSIVRIPVMKLTGISPTGLNASSEGEIRSYYDTISAYQNRFFRPHLQRVINFMQLSLWGEIDPEITFEFEPLWEQSEGEISQKQMADAQRNQVYVDMGVLSPAEVRKTLIDDPSMPYTSLDPDELPDLRQEEEQGLEPMGGRPNPLGEAGPELGGGEMLRTGEEAGGHVAGQGGGEGGPGGPQQGGGAQEGGQAQEDGVSEALVALGDLLGGGKPNGKGRDEDPFAGYDREAFDAWWDRSKHPRNPDGEFRSASGKEGRRAEGLAPLSTAHGAPVNPNDLEKVGPQMGSNAGGVYADKAGNKFYVKKGRSADHVRNEVTAAALYDLAGAPNLKYRPVAGGQHIAHEWVNLDKDNAHKFSSAEKKKAQKDFITHAWLANWDAVGTGGDNLVMVGGKPTAIDLGGALDYRARGAAKGKAFGDKVSEVDTMRDQSRAPDGSKIFAGMTPADLKSSAERVTEIPDEDIRDTVKLNGGDEKLADKLIARKRDIAKRFGLMAHDEAQDAFWNESQYKRVGKGSEAGGQFVSKSESGGGPASISGLKMRPVDQPRMEPKVLAAQKIKQHAGELKKFLDSKSALKVMQAVAKSHKLKHSAEAAMPLILHKVIDTIAEAVEIPNFDIATLGVVEHLLDGALQSVEHLGGPGGALSAAGLDVDVVKIIGREMVSALKKEWARESAARKTGSSYGVNDQAMDGVDGTLEALDALDAILGADAFGSKFGSSGSGGTGGGSGSGGFDPQQHKDALKKSYLKRIKKQGGIKGGSRMKAIAGPLGYAGGAQTSYDEAWDEVAQAFGGLGEDGWFKESDHPREAKGTEEGGQFASKEGGAATALSGGGESGSPVQNGDFDERESATLHDYVGGMYVPINRYLLGGFTNRLISGIVGHKSKKYVQGDPDVKKAIAVIDAAIAKSALQRDVTVYRGMYSKKLEKMVRGMAGKTFTMPNFSSTSLNPGVATAFSAVPFGEKIFFRPTMWEIKAPKGTHAIDMAKVGYLKEEEEILFGRGMKLKINKVDEGDESRPTTVRAEVVG